MWVSAASSLKLRKRVAAIAEGALFLCHLGSDLHKLPRSMALLSLRNVTRRFGGIVALDGISFDVLDGQIVGLIGPNGAGKTTAFNVITRLYTPNEGEVEFDGETLLKTPVHGDRARAGSRAPSRTSSSSRR